MVQSSKGREARTASKCGRSPGRGSQERARVGTVLPPEDARALPGPSLGVGGAKASGSHQQVAGSSPSGDEPSTMVSPPLSHYKGTSLKNVGRDSNGKVIPHKRSERTAKLVAVWAAGGYTKEDIAIRLNIRPGLVEECYGKELRHGADAIGMDMTNHIIKRAKGGSDRMAIFYAKAKMGWRDGESKPLDTGLLNIHIHT